MSNKTYLKEYESLVAEAFQAVITQYNFHKMQIDSQRFETWVVYQNPTTEITIGCEGGSLPWVLLADVHHPRQNSSSLEWLLVELGVEKEPTPEEAYRFPKLSQQDVIEALHKKGQQLLEYGKEILMGDFAIFPKLQVRGESFVKDCEAYQKRMTSEKAKRNNS